MNQSIFEISRARCWDLDLYTNKTRQQDKYPTKEKTRGIIFEQRLHFSHSFFLLNQISHEVRDGAIRISTSTSNCSTRSLPRRRILVVFRSLPCICIGCLFYTPGSLQGCPFFVANCLLAVALCEVLCNSCISSSATFRSFRGITMIVADKCLPFSIIPEWLGRKNHSHMGGGATWKKVTDPRIAVVEDLSHLRDCWRVALWHKIGHRSSITSKQNFVNHIEMKDPDNESHSWLKPC